MKNICSIIDLTGVNISQEIEIDKLSQEEIYLMAENASYGSLLLFNTNKDYQKAIIMCPGGGLDKINMSHEGVDFIHWMNEQNMVYGIVKYHLPNENKIATLNDSLLAIKYIRDNYPSIKKVGIMGASIGGYLAAYAAIYGESYDKVDFQILLYPVINMQNNWTHGKSRDRLFGKVLNENEQTERSLELQVNQSTPSTFIVDAADDPIVSPMNSILYCEYLMSNKIPVSFHLYPSGGHSFGFKDFDFKNEWLNELKRWLDLI